MSLPRDPGRPTPSADVDLDVELDLEPLDVELEFQDVGPAQRSSSVEISYVDAEPSSVSHGAFADARAVARRATVKRRAKNEPLALVGSNREASIRRAEFLRALAEDARGGHRARLLAAAAELFDAVGDPRAGRMLDNALAEEPVDPVALRARRRFSCRSGKGEEVVRALRREIDLPLGPLEKALAHALLADRLEAAGEPGALEEARRAHEGAPDSAAMSLAWLHAAARAGDAGEAVRALAVAIKRVRSPRLRGVLALELAHRAERAESAEAALAWAEAALTHSPELLAAHLVAIRASRKLGDSSSVRAHVAALASRIPDGPARSALLRWTARYARAHGESPDAVAKTLKLPTSAADFRLLAELAVLAGEPAEARRHLERAAELGSGATRAAALRDLAMLAIRAGERGRALEAAREASRADPGSPLEIRIRAFLGDTHDAGDPLGRAAAAAVDGDVEGELRSLREARARGEAPLAAELIATALEGLSGDSSTFLESLTAEAGRRPRSERAGVALSAALLRAREGDVRGALTTLEAAEGEPLAEHLAAELRGEPMASSEDGAPDTRHERLARLVERLVESPASAASMLLSRVDAFGSEAGLVTLTRRLADLPVIQELRSTALDSGRLSRALVAEAALLSLGRGLRGEKNPYARALFDDEGEAAFERSIAARVAELSHAPAEAARIRAVLPPAGGVALLGARLALRGGDPSLAEALASAALDARPASIAAARALEAAAMENDSPETLALAEEALLEALAPSRDGAAAAGLLHHASRFSARAKRGLQRAAELYAHSHEVTSHAEGAVRAMPDGAAAVALLERLAESYETERERASVRVRVAELAEASGDLATARRLLARAVEEDRAHPVAAEALAKVEARLGHAHAALSAWLVAADASNVTTRKASLLHEAAIIAEEGLRDEALALSLLARALGFDPTRDDTLDRAIALKEARGEEIPEAWLEAKIESEAHPAAAGDAALSRVELLRRSGQRDLALAKLEEILDRDPANAGALRLRAEMELEDGRPEHALRFAKSLVEAATRDEDRLFAHATMARLLDEHRGDLAGSAAHYGMALDLSPRDGTLRGKLAAVKARLGEPSAGEELRAAVADLRRTIERRPDRPDGWDALVSTLAACGFAAPAATIEGVAAALGTLPRRAHRHPLAALDAALLDRVAPRGLTADAREFFLAARPVFSALAPFKPERWGATPLAPTHAAARTLADLRDEGALEPWVSERVPLACVPADVEGRAVVLGREIVDHFDDDALRFFAAGAHALSVAGLAPVLQLNRADLERCIGAIFTALDLEAPAFSAHRDGPFVDAARRLLASPDDALLAAASKLAADPSFDVGALVDGATRLGHRAALARVGDGRVAIESLLALHGVASASGRELVESTRAVPSAWDLVLFSMSPACIAARRRAGEAR